MPIAGTDPINLDTRVPELYVGDYVTALVHWAYGAGGSPPSLAAPLLASGSIPLSFGTSGFDLYGETVAVEGSRYDQWGPESPGICSYFIYWNAAYGSHPDDTWAVHFAGSAIGGATAESISIPEESVGWVRHYFFGETEPDFEEITFTGALGEYSLDANWSVGGGGSAESGMGRTSEISLVGPTDSDAVSASDWATTSLSFGFYTDGPTDHIGTPGSPSCPLRWEGS